jgi:hypothetical protein
MGVWMDNLFVDNRHKKQSQFVAPQLGLNTVECRMHTTCIKGN